MRWFILLLEVGEKVEDHHFVDFSLLLWFISLHRRLGGAFLEMFQPYTFLK